MTPTLKRIDTERRKRHTERRGGPTDGSEICPLTPEKVIELVVTQKGLVTKIDEMEEKVDKMYDRMMQGKGILLGVRIGMWTAVVLIVAIVGSAAALVSGKVTVADIIAKIL